MDKYNLQKHISLRIRYLRKQKKMTQWELSEKANLGINYIYNIENKNLNIKLETLEKIIIALEVTEAEFFNFQNQDADFETTKIFEQISELPVSKRKKLLNAINLILETLESSREEFLLPLTPRSVPFGTPRFNSNNNLNN